MGTALDLLLTVAPRLHSLSHRYLHVPSVLHIRLPLLGHIHRSGIRFRGSDYNLAPLSRLIAAHDHWFCGESTAMYVPVLSRWAMGGSPHGSPRKLSPLATGGR